MMRFFKVRQGHHNFYHDTGFSSARNPQEQIHGSCPRESRDKANFNSARHFHTSSEMLDQN